jgi:hypothetical protein
VNLIPDATIRTQAFFFSPGIFGKFRRIIESHMYDSGLPGKEGTRLVGLITHSDDIIERNLHQFVDMLGAMLGYVNAGFLHGINRKGVQAMDFNACRIGLNGVTLESSGPSFCHLAAAGVARAKEQNLQLL